MEKEALKKLREQTGISMQECKKALDEAAGDIEQAKKILREKGQQMIKDRSDKPASSGIVDTYIHANGKIGVLLQLLCESDFVAKSSDFRMLAHDICLQIASSKPLFVKASDIDSDFLDGERKIYQKQFADSGKPEKIVSQIIEGKIKKYTDEVCLLSQVFVKNSDKTIQGLIDDVRAKVGERVEVGKFARFEI